MRPRASHPKPHRSWIFLLAFPPPGAARRRYRSESAHKECHIYRYYCRSENSRGVTFLQPAMASGPTRPKEREVEEAAMPGQPARARAHFRISPGNSPSRIASCHRHHRNHRLVRLERSHVFAELTLRHNVSTRNRKTFCACEEAVDDETCLWKPEEKGGESGDPWYAKRATDSAAGNKQPCS
jgi:hypothetical protein